jgi:two-component SAPR family response regulator
MQQVDVLVTDVVLDQGTGFDIQVFVQQQHPTARTLFISGYALPEIDRADTRTAWLQKPFQQEELVRSIRALSHSQSEPSRRTEPGGKRCPAL